MEQSPTPSIKVHAHDGAMADAIGSFKAYTAAIPADHFSSYDSLKKKVLLPPVKIPNANLQYIFDTLFSKDDFVTEYHEKRGDTGVSVTDWQYAPGAGDDSFCGIRAMTCTTTVQAPFSQQTILNESQRYVMAVKALGVHFSSQTPNVTMGSCFRVEVLVEFVESGPDAVTMYTYSYINFIKSVMFLKAKIESSASTELSKSYSAFGDMATQWVAEKKKPGEKKKPKKKRPVVAAAPTVAPPARPQGGVMDTLLMGGALVMFLLVIFVLWMTVSSINSATDRLTGQQQRNSFEGAPLDLTFGNRHPRHPPPSPHTAESPLRPSRPLPKVTSPKPLPVSKKFTLTEPTGETPPPPNPTTAAPVSGGPQVAEEDFLQILLHVSEMRAALENMSDQVNSQGWSIWILSLAVAGVVALQALRAL